MHSVCAVCRRKQKTKKIKHHIWLVLLSIAVAVAGAQTKNENVKRKKERRKRRSDSAEMRNNTEKQRSTNLLHKISSMSKYFEEKNWIEKRAEQRNKSKRDVF